MAVVAQRGSVEWRRQSTAARLSHGSPRTARAADDLEGLLDVVRLHAREPGRLEEVRDAEDHRRHARLRERALHRALDRELGADVAEPGGERVEPRALIEAVTEPDRDVIPGEVRFSVEFRHPSDAEIDRLDAQFPREAGFIARDCGVKLEIERVFKNPAQPFDPECVALVEQAAERLGYQSRKIVSGAGHDAVYVARRVPSAMIFTPCKDGLSHNEAESIEPGEAEAGCQVLFEAVLARANRSV